MAALDLNKLATSAAQAYLQEAKQQPNGKVEAKPKQRRLGTGAAVAMGVGLAVAARAAYRRAREVDLERMGDVLENKLKS